MLVICLNCKRLVGCCTAEGVVIDDCYHCHTQECRHQIPKGSSEIVEVIVSRFIDCRDHDSQHVGFKRKDER